MVFFSKPVRGANLLEYPLMNLRKEFVKTQKASHLMNVTGPWPCLDSLNFSWVSPETIFPNYMSKKLQLNLVELSFLLFTLQFFVFQHLQHCSHMLGVVFSC